MVILLVLTTLAIPAYSQEPAPDSADTVYMPLDCLNAGIDLVLKELKMDRGDLTFRGDYLEPDEYRMVGFDRLMNKPLDMITIAEKKLKWGYWFDESIFRDDDSINYMLVAPSLHKDDWPPYWQRDSLLTMKDLEGLDSLVVDLLIELAETAMMFEPFRDKDWEEYYFATKDSVIEGFTLLLEENTGDEFLPVAELDSLSQVEDDWALTLARMSTRWVKFQDSIDYNLFSRKLSWFAYNKYSKDSVYAAIVKNRKNIEVPYGQIIIGDTTDNHYSGDLFIVIDPGGNDTYDIEFEGTGHHTYILDYGGDDTYNMPKNRISPYFFGSNMIIDYDGDDLYNAGSWTLGAGLFGVGVLWDMKGNDRYYGDTFTMGAGCFGVGILRDDEGNDSYNAALFSQGFGFVDGVGVLIDNAGNDNYFAGGKYKDFIRYDDHYLSLSQGFGYGIRPKMSGGVGMLIDKSGNDVYISDIYGQGASYWYSLGMLADGGGNDQYISFQYAQGNGTHMSLGILYDVDGDDVYSAKGVSQGCGHDYAAGLLIDLDGDDNYNAYDLCQGAGSADGLGLIADVRGKDVYIVRSDKNTQGYGNPRRDYGSIGIFLDLAGEDHYSGGMGRDNHWWTYSTWGGGIDK